MVVEQENEKDNDNTEDDDDNLQYRAWKAIYHYTDGITHTYSDNKTTVKLSMLVVLLLGYAAYLIYACIHDFDEAFVILIITGLVVFVYGYILVRDTVGDRIYEKAMMPIGKQIEKSWIYIKW
ncbi:solute carrier family 28 member 3-like [Lytechinus pictus]|uniref:solute carrier family 28 member 3-like n=1 Tax=Lytechinus pictus TaxID=7653 RepID=UPI0030BA0FCC